MFFIYVVENLINGKMYVGQTMNLDTRRRSHFSPSSKCPYISNAIQKYGKGNFDFILLEKHEDLDQANKREIYWIKDLNTLSPNGYNLREGGDAGGKPSQETIEKVRVSNTGKKQDPAHVAKRAASNRGRKNTPETIEKMRIAARNKPPEKCSMLGKKRPAEWTERCKQWSTKEFCKRGHPMFGDGADVAVYPDGKRECRRCIRARRKEKIDKGKE